jgi:hypothetical protein
MATVTLQTLWLNLASDPSQSWSFPLLASLTSSPSIDIQTQQTADGSFRASTTPGRQGSVQCTVRCADSTQRQALEVTLLGELLCIRDNVGRKFYGMIDSKPSISEHAYNDQCDISLSFTEFTHDEAA